MWKKCLECIDELLDILFENNNIFIGENIAEDSENLAVSDQVTFCFKFVFIDCKRELERVSLTSPIKKDQLPTQKSIQSPFFPPIRMPPCWSQVTWLSNDWSQLVWGTVSTVTTLAYWGWVCRKAPLYHLKAGWKNLFYFIEALGLVLWYSQNLGLLRYAQ